VPGVRELTWHKGKRKNDKEEEENEGKGHKGKTTKA